MSVHACMTHPCPVCLGQTSPVVADMVVLAASCWLNEDCIAGYHADETECRFLDDQHCDGCTCRAKHEARPPHPSTQIGRLK